MKFDDHTETEPNGPTCPKCGSTHFSRLYTWPTQQFEGWACHDCGYEADEQGRELKDEEAKADAEMES